MADTSRGRGPRAARTGRMTSSLASVEPLEGGVTDAWTQPRPETARIARDATASHHPKHQSSAADSTQHELILPGQIRSRFLK